MLETGVLTLAATPIGNPLDASLRLVRALEEADLVAAEDTRRLRRLAAALEVEPSGEVISYHEHNEAERTPMLLDALREGRTVLLVTDAGMPVVSDPGYRAVRAAQEAGIPVTVLPGPSAVLTALAASGLAPDRFAFEGFVPRTEGRRESMFAALAAEERTLIFFDSPRRTAATLAAMCAAFGRDRTAVLARELTKTHQEVRRGTLAELAEHAARTEILGEVVLLVAGAQTMAVPIEQLVARVLERTAGGERLKDAAKQVAAGADGVGSRELYARALAERSRTD